MSTMHANPVELPDDVQRALVQRAPIEQAKGMLMAVHQITADAAFALLVSQSQGSNRKLHDVAVELLNRVSTER